MSYARTYIPPRLRPYVSGSKVMPVESSNLWPRVELSEFIVCAVPGDRTADHLMRAAGDAGYVVQFVEANSIHSLLKLLQGLSSWEADRSPPGLFLRLPGTSHTALANCAALLEDLVLLYQGPVANRLGAWCSNNSKPLHSTRLAKLSPGVVSLPMTILTSELRRSGPKEWGEKEIVKSLSGTRSQVVMANDRRLSMGASKRNACPIQIQERVIGDNIRVHVVGDFLAAVRIESGDAVDYRYDNKLIGHRYEIPSAVKEWSIKAARAEGVLLAGLDLLYSSEGEWYCFEVNPCPAYDVFEKCLVSDEISMALCRALTTGKREWS